MDLQTTISILTSSLRSLYPYMVIVMTATAVAALILALLSRRVRINSTAFGILGLFFDLDPLSGLTLAMAWFKLLVTLILIYDPAEPDLIRYIFYLTVVAAMILAARPVYGFPGRILWNLLEVAGVISVNLVNSYINETHGTPVLYGVLIGMTVLMTLFAIYLFILELDRISDTRKPTRRLETDILE